MVKIQELDKLAKRYGYSTRLWQVMEKIKKEKPYVCPKCGGTGIQEVTYNTYTSGFPDSGWVYEPKIKTVDCDLCNGEGYTSVKYKPNMVQQGWVAESDEEKDEPKTKFTYDDYLKLTPEEQENNGKKEWRDLTPEERMLILEDWGFGDDIKEFRERI